MASQQPSVGRVVHYVSHGTPVSPSGTQAFQSQCRAAIITEVAAQGQTLLTEADGREHSSDEVVVGLCVLNPTGIFLRRAAYHDGGETPGREDCPRQDVHGHPFRYCACGWIEASLKGGTWHWPERV